VPVIAPILQHLGLFQLAADGGKFVFKEDVVPGHVNKLYFILAPILAMIPALTTVALLPFGAYFDSAGQLVPIMLANVDVGLLAIFAVASLGIYSVILAGWASNSKYPFLGSVRASAQLISYELSMTISVLPVLLWINVPGGRGTLNLFDVVQMQSGVGMHFRSIWFVFFMPVSAFIFLVALFAETNRQPFDMPESEADLVGGFHTEYGAFKWSLFFVAEYCHMIVGSGVFCLLFLGGWNPLPGLPLATLADWLGLTGTPFSWSAWHPALPRQGRLVHLLLHVGALDAPPLPLRPGDENRLATAPPALHRQPHRLRPPHRLVSNQLIRHLSQSMIRPSPSLPNPTSALRNLKSEI